MNKFSFALSSVISKVLIAEHVLFSGEGIEYPSGAHSGLVKLVLMTNVFFNNQQHKTKIKRLLGVKQIMSSFFTTAGINVSIHGICKR